MVNYFSGSIAALSLLILECELIKARGLGFTDPFISVIVTERLLFQKFSSPIIFYISRPFHGSYRLMPILAFSSILGFLLTVSYSANPMNSPQASASIISIIQSSGHALLFILSFIFHSSHFAHSSPP